MSKCYSIFAALLLLFSSGAYAERYIIESDDDQAATLEVEKHGGHHIRKMESRNAHIVELNANEVASLKSRVRGLRIIKDRQLSLVGKMTFAAKPSGSVQPAQRIPWGIAAIHSREANQIKQGTGVKVCVVDTGISKNHPDLQANIIGGRNFVVIKGRIAPDAYEDDNGHGTHVAGIIAALDNGIGTVGVAPQASLIAVKVLDRQGSGWLSDIADGIDYCRVQGAHVINMSLGGDGDPTFNDPMKIATDTAVAAGVAVVVAAGNEGKNMNLTTPAGYASVIAVSAVDSSFRFASWSNYGLSAKDFAAPGVSIYSTWKGTGYNTISGTSMASPHVAGVVALKIAAGSAGVKAVDIGLGLSRQGSGLVDALATVLP